MADQHNLFNEFKAVSAETWLAKIIADLKGKNPEMLNHQVGENIVLSPFHHADTMLPAAGPMGGNTKNNEWLIAEAFDLGKDLELTNQSILEALKNGVQAVRITFDRRLSASDFTKLFKEIEPAYIHLHFIIAKPIEPIELLTNFTNILSDKKGDKNAFLGSIATASHDPTLQKWAITHLPKFKTSCIETAFGNPVDQLTTLINHGVVELTTSANAAMVDQVVFIVKIGTDFFLEIAKLRALRIVWANVLKSFGLEPMHRPMVMVEFDLGSQTDDPNQNMIRATTMAMAGVFGGTDLLTVLPAAFDEEDTTGFYRRIARNVQHILKMESFLDRVKDVAGGSYYVETLTTKIGEAVWKNLGNLTHD